MQAEFSASVSHDPSVIIIICWFAENRCAAWYSGGNHGTWIRSTVDVVFS